MPSLVLRPLFSLVYVATDEETVAPLWSKLWSPNPEVMKMEMVNFLFSKDPSAYDQVLQVCKDLKVMTLCNLSLLL
jgi:hypothetical protein